MGRLEGKDKVRLAQSGRRRRRGGYHSSPGRGKSLRRNDRRIDRRRQLKRKRLMVLAAMAAVLLLLVTGSVMLVTKVIVPAFSQDIQDTVEGTDTQQPDTAGKADEDGQAGILPGEELSGENGAGGLGETISPEESQTDDTSEVNDKDTDGNAQSAFSPLRGDTKVKGIYITGPMAGNAAFDELLTLVDETELNTMVIDVKNDNGQITYQMDQEQAQSYGACVNYITDIEGFMKKLKEHGVYTIARIVCFKDPVLAKNRPELALKKPDGTPVMGADGMAWVNPYKEGVWEYLVEIAKAAGAVGFDEVQYDYVRFPIGSDADAADYGVDRSVYTKEQAISGFLTYASQKLHEEDIIVTADVFGTIIGSETDVAQVGQNYAALGGMIDVLCPMVYPSHYGNNVFGLPVPDAQPYETVLEAMKDSAEELSAVPQEQRAIVRPWLQAFTADWVQGHITYGGEQIREQIQAVYDAGYEEWILWNASNRYLAEGLLAE